MKIRIQVRKFSETMEPVLQMMIWDNLDPAKEAN